MGLLPQMPEWLVVVAATATVPATVLLIIVGPIRAAKAVLDAIAGILHSCNDIREEWHKLRSPRRLGDRPPRP
jgi:hypothetical protein